MSDPGKLSTTMRIEIPPERADSEGNKLQEPRAVQRKSVRPDQSGETDPCATTCDAAFQNFFQNVYDAVVLTNPDGRIVDANRRAERFLQYSRDEAYGYDIMAFISGADGSVMRSIHETLENDRFVLIQAFCRRRDGGLFPAEISVNRCSLSHSPYLCFFIRDISVRKEA
jgi:PAS domain S-box-containing protein